MNEALETPSRIEPARLMEVGEKITDLITDIASAAESLGRRLHPHTAANLADLVRIMNCYYSNLIEGHNTHPRDIEKALSGQLDERTDNRNLQVEAAAHIKVQREIDRISAEGSLGEPASIEFIKWLHGQFYDGASIEMLTIKCKDRSFVMVPGEFRSLPEHDVEVGRHIPPSSLRVNDFMAYFENKFKFERMGRGAKILSMATAHHRFNYIHPFPDGNGRVSRLMSHAMAHHAGIGAQGLWSISRGLARGIESRGEYKRMMDYADTPRQGDIDGRGNLSLKALTEFTEWFLRVCLDQITFMDSLFDLNSLERRLHDFLINQRGMRIEAINIIREVITRGEMVRGDADRVTGLGERSAREVLKELVDMGILGSETPKAPVSLRFPVDMVEILFPKLFPEA